MALLDKSSARFSAIFFTSFASGLPLLLVTTTLQAWLSQAHVDLYWIGLTSICSLPYALKFLWAPLFDCIAPFQSQGRRQGWLIVTQLVLGSVFILISCVSPHRHYRLLFVLTLIAAFVSASQDTVVDAYRTVITPSSGRAIAANLLMIGYRLAMLFSGAGALLLAAYLGWHWTYCIMGLLFFVFAVVSTMIPECRGLKEDSVGVFQTSLMAWRELMERRSMLMIVLFVAVYKISDDMVMSMLTPYLIQHLGLSLQVVAGISKTVGLIAVIVGGLCGGVACKKWGLFNALMVFGCFQAGGSLFFCWLEMSHGGIHRIMAVVFFENFSVGIATVPFIALLMSVCHRAYTASQYAILSAVMSLPRVLLGPLSASVISIVGWVHFFLLSFLLGLPGLVLLWLIRYSACFDIEKGYQSVKR